MKTHLHTVVIIFIAIFSRTYVQSQDLSKLDYDAYLKANATKERKKSKLDQNLYELKNSLTGKTPFLAPSKDVNQRGRAQTEPGPEEVVSIHVVGKSNIDLLEQQLQALGFDLTTRRGINLVGDLPVNQLEQLEELEAVRFVRHVSNDHVEFHAGSVDAEGDSAQFTNVLRELYLVDGTGVKVGIISSSFDFLDGANDDILSGDLPGPGNPNGFLTPVDTVNDRDPFFNPDEGRAMAQLVHDVAPGAEIAFNNLANATDAAFAQAIDELVAAGCDIIVDDITVYTQPVYMDGLTAQAITEATNQGVLYFSSAGNSGKTSVYEKEYSEVNIGFGAPVFDFDPDPNVLDPFLEYEVNNESLVRLIVQWDEPFASACNGCPGAQTEIDIWMFSEVLGGTLLRFDNSELNQDPVIAITLPGDLWSLYLDSAEVDTVLFFAFVPDNNLPRPTRIKIKDRTEGANRLEDYEFDAPTSWGHPNAEACISVGAAFWENTPAYNDFVQVPVVGFDNAGFFGTPTSAGGNETLFDTNGNRIDPVLRENPIIVAPDGSSNTFFGPTLPQFSPNPIFNGTSAAAPTAAAAAALLLQASNNTYSPEQIRTLLTSTTIDLDDPYVNGLQLDPADPLFSTGYDFTTGFGYIQPLEAMDVLVHELGIEPLTLEVACSEDPLNERRWLLHNPNGFAITATVDSNRGGIRFQGETSFTDGPRAYLVPPGESFFSTDFPSFSTSTRIRIDWNPIPGFSGQISYFVAGTIPDCQSTQARTVLSDDGQIGVAASLEAWPNPSRTGRFNVRILAKEQDEVLMQVFDLGGRLIQSSMQDVRSGNSQLQLDLSEQDPGIYLLKVSSKNLTTTTRLAID